MSEAERKSMADTVFGRDLTEEQWAHRERMARLMRQVREFCVSSGGVALWLDPWSGPMIRRIDGYTGLR